MIRKISLYLISEWLKQFLIVVLVIALLIYSADLIETLRKIQDKDIPIFSGFYYSFLKLPNILIQTLPFLILISSVLCFLKLSKHQELVVIRASSISLLRCLLPVALIAFIIGVFITSLIHPLSVIMKKHYDNIEFKIESNQASNLSITESGLWLKEKNSGNLNIIHAPKVRKNIDKSITLKRPIVFQYKNNELNSRIEAESAKLIGNNWKLFNAKLLNKKNELKEFEFHEIPTKIKQAEISKQFTSADNISIWQLPSYISNLKKTGFKTIQHRLFFYELIALPFLYFAMSFLSIFFAFRHHRNPKTGLMMALTVIVGFITYFFLNLIHTLGLSGNIPILIAAFAPPIIILLSSFSGLIEREYG